ncbi:TetR/AcrR family transcriptional regulator [Nocardia sp. NBC_00565]|uniref:TetR/AcrR family transcriptional regulator n=1 Tax=Nocardia sp. NBC_00565 TaxID=2975993 RepID=UPI002E81990F|nr:TetR/AcrR family transcriptional regulator [Nocardia sp. NBC_00565]WUC05774.1 TetR/AcrR family transcriptional regulator [Nocardia sp. NBC_00565]
MDDSAAPALDSNDSDADNAVGDGKLGKRAVRTRNAILEASKRLFLERGYTGTRINNITDECGISRAGFYTYFRDKREIFNTLGEATYHGLLDIVARWDSIPQPCDRAAVEAWVREYFAFMDQHGAFILSAHSGPSDEDVRVATTRMQMRVVWLLGMSLRNRQQHPTAAPEALGLTTQAMLDRSWFVTHTQPLPVASEDVVNAVADYIMAVLTAP